jgi:hypothetical protein
VHRPVLNPAQLVGQQPCPLRKLHVLLVRYLRRPEEAAQRVQPAEQPIGVVGQGAVIISRGDNGPGWVPAGDESTGI